MNQYLISFKNDNIIELGGGKRNIFSMNVDVIPGDTVSLVCDFEKFPYPLDTVSYAGLYSAYCLEHITWMNLPNFLKECYRILRPNSKAVFLTANLYEQCKKVINEGVNEGTVELLFGSQEFPNHAGCHKVGFSPEYAKRLFEEAGFNPVKVISPMPDIIFNNNPIYPHCVTDLIIEAYKPDGEIQKPGAGAQPASSVKINSSPTPGNPKPPSDSVFEREYFEDGTIGYLNYRDFATHYTTARIIEDLKPKSVLSVGSGRGYVARILENHGIRAVAMDISRHCQQTKAVDSFILWDATKIPWLKQIPNGGQQAIGDKEFDVTFSMNFLEHIPEKYTDDIIREMARVSSRGLHGIHFTESPYKELDEDIDTTHVNIHPKSWWVEKFKTVAPEYNCTVDHPRVLEYEQPEQQPPISHAPAVPDSLVKLNIGSYMDCFYYNWLNIDILDLREFADRQAYRFQQHDITKGLPFDDNSIDIIMHSHLIEHLSREEGERFLQECHRVLKPQGIIRVSTPDTRVITKRYLDGDIWEYKYINVGVERAGDDAEAYYNLLLAGHKTIYDEDSLSKLLEKTGFKEIKRVSPFESRSKAIQTQALTTHPNISIVLEATADKPVLEQKKVTVT